MLLERDLNEEQIRRVKSDPRVWVANAWQHPIRSGDPYDFKDAEGETTFNYMIDDDGPMVPSNWADINLFLMARGCLKSSITRMVLNWAHDCYPSVDSYFAGPTNKTVLDWTKKFRKNVKESDLDARRVTDNKTHQQFSIERERDDGSTYPVDSHLQTDSGYSEEHVRGPHSQIGLIDETQDLPKSVFDVFYPAIDAHHPELSWAPAIFCIGTPKQTGTFFHRLWELSDKRTWDAESQSWISQKERESYTIGESEAADLDIDLDEVEGATVAAWHIDWRNSPKHDESQLLTAKAQLDPQEFHNEILAEFYDPEDNLLSDRDVEATFDSDMPFQETPMVDDSTVAMGVDWGGGSDKNAGDTVLTVAEQIESVTESGDTTTETNVLNLKFLDNSLSKPEQIRKVEEWILQYDVDRCVIDRGFGDQASTSLQDGEDTRYDDDGYEDIVTACRYNSLKNKQELQYGPDDRFFTADKTRSVSMMVDWFRKGNVTIPTETMDESGNDSTKVKLIRHLTSPYKTLNDTRTGDKRVYIETLSSRNDDAFDTLVYIWIALHMMDDNDYYTGMSMGSRSGYS